MSGTRIPKVLGPAQNSLPGKPGIGKPEVSSRRRAEPQAGEKPETGGQRPLKTGGVNSPVSGKKASSPGSVPGSSLPQKTVFRGQAIHPLPGGAPPLNSFPKDGLFEKAVEAPGESPRESPGDPFFARELFKQTAASLGLPGDSLSVALLVFSRFFSLSLTPAFIGQLRRDILASGKTSSPETAGEKAALEAEALAAVIAADKGVILSPEALERYAGFLVPPVKPLLADEEENPKDRKEAPNPEELRAIAGEGQEDGFLDLLNSFPGKNGQHWMVLPFSINVQGTELRIFLRILKKEFLSTGEDGQLIADISGPKRQWRCSVRKNSGKYRADIQVYPECSPKSLSLLQKEAECFLTAGNVLWENVSFEEVLVKSGNDVPSWVDDLLTTCLPSISKDV